MRYEWSKGFVLMTTCVRSGKEGIEYISQPESDGFRKERKKRSSS